MFSIKLYVSIFADIPLYILLQAMYGEFSTANIQVDKDFNAKLSGYGCVGHIPPQEEISTNSSVSTLCVLLV